MPKLPLRTRLTLWYTLSLSLILLLFSGFLYVQMRRSLLAQLDTALQLNAAQLLLNLDMAGDLANMTQVEAIGYLQNEEYVAYLLDENGELLARWGAEEDVAAFREANLGYSTLASQSESWRIYNQMVVLGGQTGQLQVMRELDLVEQTLGDLLGQIMVAIPAALALAAVGGFFLAARALRPIAQMTETAQRITAQDLQQRIGYQGAADEIGRLAQTFDAMLERLQQGFARERRFTADAAHELRTPLTALKGRIEVTMSQARSTQTYVDTLQEMEEQVDRLIRLSNDLLFMARLEQGQSPLQMERIDLNEFLSAVVDQIRPLAQTKAITLTEHVPDNLPIQGQLDLLIRLFLNVLDNAVKYTPPNGRVTLTASTDQKTAIIAIRDSGQGIAPEHLPHLFDRFYRAESDRARPGGAGLGLAIAQEIARVHGGELAVNSVVGEGTTVTVKLLSDGS